MAKIVLNDLASLTNEASAISTLANNNDALETAIENTLSRDGTSPNSMAASLDMNSHSIINLPAAVSATEPVRKSEFDAATISTFALGTNGIMVCTTSNHLSTVSLIAPAAGITIANADGTSGNPSFILANDLAALEGISATSIIPFRSAADTWSGLAYPAVTVDNTVPRFDSTAGNIQTSGVIISDSNAVSHGDGTQALPGVSFISETSTGLWRIGAATLGLGITNTEVARFGTGGMNLSAGNFFNQSGAVGAPSYSFVSDTTTGFYRVSAGVVSFTSAGTATCSFTSTGLSTIGLYLKDATNPSNFMQIKWNEDAAADRILNILVGAADRTVTLSGNLTVSSAATISGTNTGDQTITLTSDVTGTGTGSFATTIANNAVTDAKLRQGAALTVIGRSANSTGNVADIAASAGAGSVLRESGSTIGFGTVAATTALSDYAEGSWTPTIEGTTTAGTQTYTTQLGRYIRIGNIVHVFAQIALSAKDGATAGNIAVGGLPFTVRNLSAYNPQATIAYQQIDLNTAGSYYAVAAFGQPNTTKIWLFEIGDNVNYAALGVAKFGATTGLVISMTYFIN